MAFTAKPDEVPEFALLDQEDPITKLNNIEEPTTAKKNYGWDYLEKPKHSWLNWIFSLTSQWISFFNQFFSATHQFQINEIVEYDTDEGVKIGGLLIKDGGMTVDWTSPQTLGSGLSISGATWPTICAMTNQCVAFIDEAIEELRCYTFNSNNWSLVGSGLSISGIGFPSITALNSSDIAFIDSTNKSLRTYRWNSGTSSWGLVGSGLSISGIGNPSITALNSSDIAFIDSTLEELRCYRFDFDSETWSKIGNELNISGVGSGSITALNGTDIVLMDEAIENLQTYRWDFGISNLPPFFSL